MSDLVDGNVVTEEDEELARVAGEEEQLLVPPRAKPPPMKLTPAMIEKFEQRLDGTNGTRLVDSAAYCNLMWETTWQGKTDPPTAMIEAVAAVLKQRIGREARVAAQAGKPFDEFAELKVRLRAWKAAHKGTVLIDRPRSWFEQLKKGAPKRIAAFTELLAEHVKTVYGEKVVQDEDGQVIRVGSLYHDRRTGRLSKTAGTMAAIFAGGKAK